LFVLSLEGQRGPVVSPRDHGNTAETAGSIAIGSRFDSTILKYFFSR
jgi:hypothetical protein